MTQYESEFTKFMREYLEAHPEEIESQREGRAVWWDKIPENRTLPFVVEHSPKSGGAEYTFKPDADRQ